MKRWICLLLTLVMVLGLAACDDDSGSRKKKDKDDEKTSLGGLFENHTVETLPLLEPVGPGYEPDSIGKTESQLSVGFGRENITPDFPVYMDSGVEAASLRDYLYATCVAIRFGDETFLIYSLDLLQIDGEIASAFQDKIAESTGIVSECIFLNATNTHSSVDLNAVHKNTEQFKSQLVESLIAVGTAALCDLVPATVAYGSVQTKNMAYNQYYRLADGSYAGPGFSSGVTPVAHVFEADPTLQLVRFAREDKKDVVLMNFTVPPALVASGSADSLSGDYVSMARSTIEQGSDCLVAFFMGAGADQTHSSRLATAPDWDSSDCRAYGEKLAQYALTGLENMTAANSNEPKINIWGTSCEAVSGDLLYLNYNAISFGDMAILFMPYQISASCGTYIQENSPFHTTFLVTCCESSYGFAPDSFFYDIGAPEAVQSLFPQGAVEDQLTWTVVPMLQDLYEN